MLADFIVGLVDVAPDLAESGAPALEDAVVALLASALHHGAPDTPQEDPALAPVLRRRVLDFIDANLSEPELGPATLTRQFRVSRAHLYRMFEQDGGVAKVVRERRLDAAYRALLRPAAPSIAQLAHDFGFSGSGQFQRAFRARFDITPGDARREGATSGVVNRTLAGVQQLFASRAEPYRIDAPAGQDPGTAAANASPSRRSGEGL
ncbi:MAG: helix-turn-helix domain-containing protein [Candidatus Kaistia colombiensis]|nr:MAG: helix-turn-helix domain-containing protein [Kaistia sp.]